MRFEIVNAKQTPLRDEDVKSIVEIERHPMVKKWLIDYADEDFEKELEEYKKFFTDLQNNNLADVLIAKHEGRAIGFLALWRINEESGKAASIGISVHPDYWRKGIATSLVKESIRLAKGRGIGKLIIETLEENSAMKHVAEKIGFKLEGVRRILKDGTYHNEDVYVLNL
ncbi:GNAT family N-acetyltransferase [Candidatus Bathyarchaeota archaeon]|nr:GNAT family N-acetyltransferase [Candidatus Bathyarchaeota archaeon]